MNIDLEDKEKLITILETASSKAAESISMMIDHPVSTEIINLEDDVTELLGDRFEREDLAVMVYSEIELGEGGITMFLLSEKSAMKMANLLMMRDVDADIGMLEEEDLSALEEVGNIVIGNFMGEIFDTLDLGMLHTPPEVIHDMIGAGFQRIIGYTSMLEEDSIITNIKFKTKEMDIEAIYLLIPSDELNEDLMTYLG